MAIWAAGPLWPLNRGCRDEDDRPERTDLWKDQRHRPCGGGGGGRPNMAQAGGKDASKIEQALEKAKEVIQQQL